MYLNVIKGDGRIQGSIQIDHVIWIIRKAEAIQTK